MSGQERLPGRFRAALRCGLDTVGFEDRFDRGARHVGGRDSSARRGCECSPRSGSRSPCVPRARRCPAWCSGDPGVASLSRRTSWRRAFDTSVTSCSNLLPQCAEPRLHPVCVDAREGLPVHAGRAAVRTAVGQSVVGLSRQSRWPPNRDAVVLAKDSGKNHSHSKATHTL